LKKVWQRFVIDCTGVIKMVRLIPSTMFVKDPVDVWGKEVSIGPAEQAIRSQFPYVYNKSGNVIYWDDFESPTVKPGLVAAGAGSCNRTADKSLFGDFSMKFVTGAVVGNGCSADYYLNNFRAGKLGVLASFMTNAVQVEYMLTLDYSDGVTNHVGRIKVDVSDGKVYYGYPATNIYLGTVSWYTSGSVDLFMPMKLVVDFDNGVFDTLYIARNEIDMSSIDLYSTGSTVKQHMQAEVAAQTKAASSNTVYIDNVVITDNEQ